MTIEIDSNSDELSDVAKKVREEFGHTVVAIQAGDSNENEQYAAASFEPKTTFREIIGTIEYGKFTHMKNHD